MIWRCEPEWSGETGFLVAGGPSVLTQNLELLRGRRVLVINSSIHAVPWADMLFFGDWRWYADDEDNKKAVNQFRGVAICGHSTAPSKHPIVKKMRRIHPLLLPKDREVVAYRRTSVTAGITILVHRGVSNIVLLGCDGRRSVYGRSHHHKPHRWPVKEGCWDKHRAELRAFAPHVEARGVRVINASPGSAWDMWPVMNLEQAIDVVGEKRAA